MTKSIESKLKRFNGPKDFRPAHLVLRCQIRHCQFDELKNHGQIRQNVITPS